MLNFHTKHLFTSLSGADVRLLSHAEAGKTAWTTIGLNVLVAALFSGASAALMVKLLLSNDKYLVWLWTGILIIILSLVALSKILKHLLPKLNNPLLSIALTLILIFFSLTVSLPFEANLVKIAEPGKVLVDGTPVLNQLKNWLTGINGADSLTLLRFAIRTSSFIVLALPFFVGWSARKGTFTQVRNAEKELKEILSTTK